MDIATLGGLLLGFALVVVVMVMDGGSPAELFTAPQAILLTIGGALIATLISYPVKSLASIPKWFMLAFFQKRQHPDEAIDTLVRMADKARREGLLSLEDEAKKLDNEFLRKGLMLVIDGIDPAQVRTIMDIETQHMVERHEQGIGFFTAAGGYGPTMGIIGTVMGLISVLQELDNPGELGKSIATAFLATLWGILSANMIWLPLAGKLKANNDEEVAYRNLLKEGILSLQAGENPRIVREKLMAFLPPKGRQASEEAPAAGVPAKGKAKAQA
jgi:chemotaxis protein MotA